MDVRLDDRILLPDTTAPPRSTPGAYQLTAEHEQSINTRAREWVPFALASASQFRSGGPPALNSREYARELAEVRDIGQLAGTRRSPDEEQIALWHLEPGYVQLNRVARAEAGTDGRDQGPAVTVQVAVEQAVACGIGICMTCVLPVRGADGRTRMLRSCTEGPVLDASRVRWDCVGRHGASVPADAVGAPEGGAA